MISILQNVRSLTLFGLLMSTSIVFAQGNGGNANGNGNGGSNDSSNSGSSDSSSTSTPPPPPPDLPVKCVLVPDAYSNNLEQFVNPGDLSNTFTQDYISKNFNPLSYVNSSGSFTDTNVIVTTRFADRIFLRAYCFVESSNAAPASSQAVINSMAFDVDSAFSKPCNSHC